MLKIGLKINHWQVLEINGADILCFCLGCNQTKKNINKWNLLSNKSKSCGCQKVVAMKKTNLEKYDVEFTQQDLAVKQKSVETLQEKYGVVNFAHHSSRLDKIKSTNLEKYGVEYYPQSSEFKQKRSKKKPFLGQIAYGFRL